MRKFLTVLALLIVGSCSAIFAACTTSNNKVQISFDTDGGAALSAVEVDKGTEYELPIPEKSGYEFEGWYLTEDKSGDAVSSVVANDSSTYYAKWSKLYNITLNADGGTLAQTSLSLKEGANLYNAVKDYVPVKTDYQFDAWVNGTAAVTLNERMPAQDVTLTARYKVKYVVEVYKENLDGSGYTKDSEDLVDYGYVGAVTAPEIPSEVTTGFTAVSNQSEVKSLTLSATASQNVYKFYFDRETYTVSFRANYPNGENVNVKTVGVKYGNEVELPNDVSYAGYCLVGWATTASGDVAYQVDAVSDKLYNAESNASEPATFLPQNNVSLYAVWLKGYTDMFGGDDVVYLFDDEATEIYLCRGGVFFKGEYRAAKQSFTFTDEGDIYFEGKILTEGKFVYYSENRAVSVYYKYHFGLTAGGVRAYYDDKVQVHFDGYDGISYTVEDSEGKTTTSEGKFVIKDATIIATFTEGELSGQTLNLVIGTVSNIPVFQVRNDDELNMGTIMCAEVKNGQLVYYTSLYSIELNGYGSAVYVDQNSKVRYYYFIEDDLLVLASTSSIYKVAKFYEINNQKFYIEYEVDYDFTANNGNDVLTLDGIGNATYTSATETLSGIYTTAKTCFGDYLVNFYVNGSVTKTFIVTKTEVPGDVDDGAAESEPTVTYSFVEKSAEYAEYNYYADKKIYPNVVLKLNDGASGKAEIYSLNENNEMVKISEGTYAPASGMFVYTASSLNVPEGVTLPFPVNNFASFVFSTGNRSTISGSVYYVNYWFEYTNGEGTTKLSTEYTGENGATLALFNLGTVAAYKTANSEEYVVGNYSLNEGTLTLAVSGSYLYFKLDEEAKTFEKLNFAPYSINAINAAFNIDENLSLSFNGKGSDEYFEASYSETKGENVTVVEGKMTDNRDGTFTFTSNDNTVTFDYMLFVASNTRYFVKYNPDYNGRYLSDDGILELDGFGGSASLVCSDGNYEGMYFIPEDNTVVIRTDNGYVYVDIKADREFTVRGEEYGSYILVDNQSMENVYFALDGYGKVSVYKMVTNENNENERQYIDENGSYTIQDEEISLSYHNGAAEINLIGKLSVYIYNNMGLPIFVISYSELAHTYVSTSDWSIINLDGNGGAIRYDNEGVEQEGSYIVITDNLFYFVSDDQAFAAIYKINAAEGTATPLKLRARGYYTADMESLLFSRYGFAIFNGADRYYYDVVDNNVVIYRRAQENETGANKYGFISEQFGQFDNTITYGGKTYIYNDGYDITFNRSATGAEKYPVNLGTTDEPVMKSLERIIFTPSGNEQEYMVNGKAYINGTQYDCTVTRVYENEVSSYYVTVGTYRFYVNLTYGGMIDADQSASSFEVTKLQQSSGYFSDTYLQVFMILQAFGINYPNNFGNIYLATEYNEDGSVNSKYVNAVFGKDSGIFDHEGELITLNKVPYTVSEDGSIYTLRFECKGYYYNLQFKMTVNSSLRMYAYVILSFTREQTLIFGDYRLEMQTLLMTETNGLSSMVGKVDSAKLYKGEQEIKCSEIYNIQDGLYFVSRTTDAENKITATEYYKVTLTSAALEEGQKYIPLYTEATVSKLESVVTYYDAAGVAYVDVDTVNNQVLLVAWFDETFGNLIGGVPSECSYDQATATYTAKVDAKVYTIKIVEGKAVITEVTVADTSDTNS